jgi:hypothetical protein
LAAGAARYSLLKKELRIKRAERDKILTWLERFYLVPKNISFSESLDKCSNRYPRWGGRGLCLEAEKTEARKMLENRAESPASSARFVGQISLVHTFAALEK